MWKAVAVVILLCTVSMCKSTNNATFYGLDRNNISIPITRPSGIEELICTLRGNKVLEWEIDQGVSYFGSFFGRTILTNNTIEIHNLQRNDSGIYTLSFIYSDGLSKEKIFSLIVSAPLPQPTINCTANGTSIRLECNFKDGPSATILWMHQGSIVELDDNFDLTLENKCLTISNPERSSGEYACIVKQHGDQAQSDPISVEKCYSRGNGRGHVALITFLLVLVVICIGIFTFCWYQKNKNKNDQNEYRATSTEEPNNVSPEGVGVEPKPSPSSEVREDI